MADRLNSTPQNTLEFSLKSYNDAQVAIKETEVFLCQKLSENLKQHASEGSQASAIYPSEKGTVNPLTSSAYFTRINIKNLYNLKINDYFLIQH